MTLLKGHTATSPAGNAAPTSEPRERIELSPSDWKSEMHMTSTPPRQKSGLTDQVERPSTRPRCTVSVPFPSPHDESNAAHLLTRQRFYH